MNFLHIGSLGDVIYSIPAIRSIQVIREPKGLANVYLYPDVRWDMPAWAGTRQPFLMSKEQCQQLLPLLRGQRGLGDVALFNNQTIDVNLNDMRETGFPLDRGDITRYYAYAHKCSPNTATPWLDVQASTKYFGAILVNRTTRYLNKNISYKFLSGRPNVYFVGFPNEHAAFSKDCPGVPRIQAEDFRQLASWVAGCKAVIGNQSFLFSLAEALKMPRLLEVFPQSPNVIIHGHHGWDAISQDLFQSIAEDLVA